MQMSSCGPSSDSNQEGPGQAHPFGSDVLALRELSDVERALTASGLNICQKSSWPHPNKGYGYEKKVTYYLSAEACPAGSPGLDESLPPLPQSARESLASVAVETYGRSNQQNRGIATHKDEFLTGTSFAEGRGYFSDAGWRYGQFVIEVGHWSPDSATESLIPALNAIGAELVYDNRDRPLKPVVAPTADRRGQCLEKVRDLMYALPEEAQLDAGAEFGKVMGDGASWEYLEQLILVQGIDDWETMLRELRREHRESGRPNLSEVEQARKQLHAR